MYADTYKKFKIQHNYNGPCQTWKANDLRVNGYAKHVISKDTAISF